MKKTRLSLLMNNDFIFALILLNSVTIFLEGFVFRRGINFTIDLIDSIITIMFLLEAIVKIRHWGWKNYIKSGWNKMDFILVVISLPSVYLLFTHFLVVDLHFLLVFRILRISRVIRFMRFFRFLPGINNLFSSITRALRTSVFIVIGLGIYNFVIAVLSCHIFKDYSPELFGNPLRSLYSTFKIFTIEGWYEIPEEIVANMESKWMISFTKGYFIIILVTGGILGLSLVNSILVDSMVSDNNDNLEKKVDRLNQKIEKLTLLLEQINHKTDDETRTDKHNDNEG